MFFFYENVKNFNKLLITNYNLALNLFLITKVINLAWGFKIKRK